MEYGWWTPAKIWTAIILSVALVIGLGVVAPLAGLYTQAQLAPTKAKLGEKIQVNTPANMIAQYNLSYDEMGTYKSDLEAVYENWVTLNTFDKEYTPADIAANQTGQLAELQQQDQGAVNGSQNVCTQAANKYNEDGSKLQTGATFRGQDLPKTVSLGACEKGKQS